MAKLSFRLIIFLCSLQFLFGQDTLCIYKAKGMSLLEINDKQSTIKKGALIKNTDIVKVLPNAELTAIDNTGNTYIINIEGTYGLSHLKNFKKARNKSNLTIDYLKHIWQELRNKNNKKALIAGVFRGETLMTYPKDRSKIASSKITFRWDTFGDTGYYYIFLKNIITEELLKIETNGSQLALHNDNPIFYESDTFEWTVTTEAFPNLDNTPFFSFSLIDRNEYETLKKEFSSFITDLEALGHTETEIETIICNTYGLCK